jgi:peptidoglycan hydrolase-like protein with peptidoglycan-binding domain
MASPKRKSPDRKPAAKSSSRRKQPSLASRALGAVGAGLASHPRLIGGVVAFGVVFSFVAANALWYQPRHHPAPLLATRMFENRSVRTAKAKAESDAPAEEPGVTTYRIERQADKPAVDSQAKPAASPLVRQVQQALAGRGLYDGPADGVTGPKTTSAILFFEETEGMEQDGEPSAALLARIRARDNAVAVIPDERPSPDITASTSKSETRPAVSSHTDDVADMIRAAEPDTATSIKPTPVKAVPGEVSSETVMQIQKALAGFAYADIKIDGVPGEATRTAIRAFEKSYNMPVTGVPSIRVLKKLKSIGAL